jgi:hypothetical protein
MPKRLLFIKEIITECNKCIYYRSKIQDRHNIIEYCQKLLNDCGKFERSIIENSFTIPIWCNLDLPEGDNFNVR